MKIYKGLSILGLYLMALPWVSAQMDSKITPAIQPGEMITIPAGWFIMGNDSGSWEERPAHPVYLPAYQIGKYEVTRGEYRRFIEAGGYEDPRYWSPEGWVWKEGDVIVYAGMYGAVKYDKRAGGKGKRNAPDHWEEEQEWIGHGYGHPRFKQTDNHPVIGVTYYEAEAYCKWAGGRLPTEAEYEKAARWTGTKSNLYPYGDIWDPEKSNNPLDHNPAGGGFKVNQSAPVGSYPDGASPYGCLDMIGNAYEWSAGWARSYPGAEKAYDYSGQFLVVKGGCWDDPEVTCAYRSWYLPPSSAGTGPGDSDYIGFRMARSIPVTKHEAGPITFGDVTEAVGLEEPLKGVHGHSVAWGDINNDGYPDLFVGTFATHADEKYAFRGHGPYPEPDKLFLNNGGKVFTEVTPSPTEVKGMSSGAAFADFDNDGFLDLVTSHIANTSEDTPFGQSNGLYRNDGKGGMIDVSEGSNLIFNVDTVVVSARNTFVLDYDGDGLLDLLMQDDDCWRWSIGRSHLMRNMGNMVFRDVTIEAGLPEDMNGLGGFVGDINNDTWPDIFFAHTNVMYLNNRDGTFRKLNYEFFDPKYGASAKEGNLVWTCGAEIGDLNGDGLLDIVMGDHFGNTLAHKAHVYITKWIDENGDPHFEEVSEQIGIDTVSQKEPYVAIEDLDNDGDMDIIVSTRESFVYTNTGNGPDGLPQFTGPTGSNGPTGGLQYWPAGGMADYDRDGRLDYLGPQWYAEERSPLLRNITEGGEDYIAIRMDMPDEKNRNGIGAMVRIYEAGKAGRAEALLGVKCISVSNGYSGGCPAEAHFGTPGQGKVDITITMPCDGNVYTISRVATRQLFTFTAIQ